MSGKLVSSDYVNYTIDITYEIIMPVIIVMGLIGNLAYFWCFTRMKRKVNVPSNTTQPDLRQSNVNNECSHVETTDRVIRGRQINPKTNIYFYIRALTISDCFVCLNLIVVPTVYIACYTTCRRYRWFVNYSIKVGFPLMDLFTNFSNIIRVVISLDRLWALVYPFNYRTTVSNSRIKYLLSAGFLASFILVIPYAWGFGIETVDTFKTDRNHNYLLHNISTNGTWWNVVKPMETESYVHVPKTPWFPDYRKLVNVIMSVVPFMISTFANAVIIYHCFKLSKRRNRIKSNFQAQNADTSRWLYNIGGFLTGKFKTNEAHAVKQNRDGLPIKYGMRKQEFRITILMVVLNIHFIINTLPMTFYMFMYQPWADTFTSKRELWLQNIAYLTKYGNNALSVYISLFLDPIVKDFFWTWVKSVVCCKN